MSTQQLLPAKVVKCSDRVHPWEVQCVEDAPIARFIERASAEGYVALGQLLLQMQDRIAQGPSFHLGDDLSALVEHGLSLIKVGRE